MVDIKSLDFGTFNRKSGLYEGKIMTPKIQVDYNLLEASAAWQTYEVQSWQEMRIDLILNDIYGEYSSSLEAMDVILALNGIDNPLNIKAGMILKIPSAIDQIDNFRYTEAKFRDDTTNSKEFLGKRVNKNTKVDQNRKKFLDNNYALPPTVNKTPINPVRIESNNLIFGGVK